MAMEDLSSLFFYQENVDDLKQKLVYMAYELQSARMQAREEARKNKENTENIKNLLHLLQLAHKERDETKEQLHKSTLNSVAAVGIHILSPERRTSSGLTDSNNSLSDTTNYNNNNNNNNSTSQGDSLYDVIISPVIKDFPNASSVMIDPETQAIFDLAKGKPLPKKGRLLEAVMEAGPLLQTLMVAGSLPQWRNPPPTQPLQVPPVGISVVYGNKNPCGSLDFTGGGGGGFMGYGSQMISTPKRQRIQ